MPWIRNKLGRARRLAGRVVGGLWSQEGTLGQQVMRGAFWTVANEWTSKGLTFVQTVILVRLLVPADFGIMRVSGFLLAGMAVFTRTGMDMAVIQRKDADRETVDTAWTINLLRDIVLYAGVFLVAPWAARFYENPIICPILRVLGLKLLFNGFKNIGLTLLKKDLDFRVHEIFMMTTVALGVTITIVAAFILRSVWAIAIGQAAGMAGVRAVGSYVVHPYRPRFRLRLAEARRLFGFGKWMLAAGIVVFLKTQGDDAILGKMLGMEALGFYTLAYALSNLPAKAITHMISAVTFPAYSKLQDDKKRLGNAFLRVLRVNGALVVPAAAGLFVLAPDIVGVVYGNRYMPMVGAFRILCIFGLFRALATTCSPVFNAVGKPWIITIAVSANVVVMLAVIFPLTQAYGIAGTSLATLIPYLVEVPLYFAITARLSGLAWTKPWRAVIPAFLATGVMMVCLFLMKTQWSAAAVSRLLLFVVIGFTLYVGTVALFCRRFARETWRMVGDLGAER